MSVYKSLLVLTMVPDSNTVEQRDWGLENPYDVWALARQEEERGERDLDKVTKGLEMGKELFVDCFIT